MSYREGSKWNDINEILCLIIFKKLEEEEFPYGKQIEYCRNMSCETTPIVESINAKVNDYKSVAGINNPSHPSKNTKIIYEKYNNFTIKELEDIVLKLNI